MEDEINTFEIFRPFEYLNKENNSTINSYFFNIKKFNTFIVVAFLLIICFISFTYFNVMKEIKNENQKRILKEFNKDIDFICETGDEDKCLKCDTIKNVCSKCNLGYKLVDGKCIANYSFKAKYFSNSANKTINLLNPKYEQDIIEITFNNETIPVSSKYIFPKIGNHTLYFLMKNPLNNSLSKMFSGIESLTYISFSSKYNTENVTDFSEMFAYCSSLISINFANLNAILSMQS